MYVCITFISDSAIQNNRVIQCWGPECGTAQGWVFSGPLSLRAYVPEIKFNNKNLSKIV